MVSQIPIAEGLFTWPAEVPTLLAGRVPQTGQVMFPRRATVMLDDGSLTDTEVVELPRRGRLWTFTTQNFEPPLADFIAPSGGFQPFSLGYVELDGNLRVETRLTEPDVSKLHIGQEMELVIEALGQDVDGNEVVTFAFAPVEEEVAA